MNRTWPNVGGKPWPPASEQSDHSSFSDSANGCTHGCFLWQIWSSFIQVPYRSMEGHWDGHVQGASPASKCGKPLPFYPDHRSCWPQETHARTDCEGFIAGINHRHSFVDKVKVCESMFFWGSGSFSLLRLCERRLRSFSGAPGFVGTLPIGILRCQAIDLRCCPLYLGPCQSLVNSLPRQDVHSYVFWQNYQTKDCSWNQRFWWYSLQSQFRHCTANG